MQSMRHGWLALSLSLVLGACGQAETHGQVGTGIDTGSNTSTDTGSGSESDISTDTGTDTGTDAGSTEDAMVLVPAGSFWMGCHEAVDHECLDDERPYHEVTLDAFYIDTYEVRAAQFRTCVLLGRCTYGGPMNDSDDGGWGVFRNYNTGRDNHPVNYVNWFEAKKFCEAYCKRLPTEAEWERAARGTDGRKYPWGNSPLVSCDYAVMDDGGWGCGSDQTMEVGSRPLGVSPEGAHDMLGNVYEWTADAYDSGYFAQTPDGGWVNPSGPDNGEYRLLRGGSSFYDGVDAFRASSRNYNTPSFRNFVNGFRCAKSL